jgi:hypothetical protein
MALRRTILLVAWVAVAVAIAVLCGCQPDKQGGQGESRSSKTTAQAQTTEKAQQTQGGDLGQAPSKLGLKVDKIMESPFYRYGQWGYLEVDPSDGRTVRSMSP